DPSPLSTQRGQPHTLHLHHFTRPCWPFRSFAMSLVPTPPPQTGTVGALAGLRVLDISRILGGPYCGQILGDHGADVLKVEPPQGDDTRTWGPPYYPNGVASYYYGLNRNKRVQTLDFSQAEGRERLL